MRSLSSHDRCAVSFVLAFFAACSTDTSQQENVAAPDPETVRAIELDTGEHLEFETMEMVDALSYGLVGDGSIDNTAAFRKLLANGNRTIYFPAGDYVTGSITIPSNTILVLEPGVTIRDSGRLLQHDRLLKILGENVRIEGLGARIVSNRETYVTGEQRHGIFIYGANRVSIFGIESADHGGDGFYIGGPSGDPATNILLKGCRADNNRRQGLSITSARRVRVVSCEFVNTNGTAPQFGVDLEPNHSVDYLDDITFLRPYTSSNVGGGIMIELVNLDASSAPASILIAEHSSFAEPTALHLSRRPDVNMTLRYSRSR